MEITKTDLQTLTIKPSHSSQQLSEKKNSSLIRLTGVVLFLGVALRLYHFFLNRSLWTDEIYLAVSLIRMNYLELMAPALEYEQKAPIGFLWLVRTSVLLFGEGEMALRLVPLLSGIAALFLFVPLSRYFLKPAGALVALGILAFAPPLVYHAVEIKQYGFEMAITIVALLLYTRFHNRHDTKALLLWGFSGALLVWFSYTAIFILAGIAISISALLIIRKQWSLFFKALIPFSIWLVSFGLNFFLFTYQHADSGWLASFFRHYGGFMPLPPRSANDMAWFVQTPYKMLFYPLGLLWNNGEVLSPLLKMLLKVPVVSFLFLFAGLLSFGRNNGQRLLILTVPLLLHLLASAFEFYPITERFLVYAAPLPLLWIGRGTDAIFSFIKTSLARVVMVLLLVTGPIAGSAMQLMAPETFGGYKYSTQRQALLYVDKNFKEGDAVYLYWNAEHPYRYYKEAYQLKYDAVIGSDIRFQSNNTTDYLAKLAADFNGLNGKKRVWVVYNTKQDIDIGDEITKLPKWYTNEVKGGAALGAQLRKMGPEVQTYKTRDVDVSLFDFSQEAGKRK